jgi:aminoglycoside 6'-N-acetyltransferase
LGEALTVHDYRFRPVRAADYPMLRRWREQPHVAAWWGAPDVEDAAEWEEDARVRMWIVEHAGRPFAYAQDYDPHGWDGIDQYIGEPDMIGAGHGSAFARAHCDRLFDEGAPAIGTDPHPDNGRAIRAYEKAGFAMTRGPVETLWGTALLMERWR